MKFDKQALWAGAAASATLMLLCPGAARAQDSEPEHAEEEATELEDIVVQSTRSRRRVQDEPVRVEVINQEEIEEKLLMRPGNISMILAETGGLRVQVTSPGLGAANIRVQGLRGRYTQLLADGLPLYGGQALGGVINLISRRPGDGPQGELILNATTRDGQDVSAYGSTPLIAGWSGSLLATYNHQAVQDLDDDGWIDMAGYGRWSARPRLFWTGDDGATAFLTLGGLSEKRRGGTRDGRVTPDGRPFRQDQDTERADAGLIYDRPLGDRAWIQARASGVEQSHDHRYGDVLESDRHRTALVEASASADAWGTSWLGGLAWQRDDYASDAFPAFDYRFEAPAVFGQVEKDVGDDLTLAASARYDDHSAYGGQFSPRVSALFNPGPWTVRASWGQGFYAPTPFIEETEASGLSRLEPLSGLKAETAATASLDLGYATGSWETSVTLFAADIEDAVRLQTVAPDRVRLVNVDGVTRTRGGEALARWRNGPWVLTGSYLYVDAAEPADGGGRRAVPLTPRHSAGFVAMWEEHDRGRIGFEAYYTGAQPLEDDPYRTEGDSYVELGLLGEIVLGRYRVFLNLENLLDVRQTREAPVVRPGRAPDGRWTVDAWAPLEGFVANAGVRIRFGAD